MKIFVSYSRRDAADFVDLLRRYFTNFNYDIFIDVDSIKAGEVWSNTIEENISNCDIFVVIVTFGALQSKHVEREVLQAQREKKIIVPCFHRSVIDNDIKWGLNRIQGIEFKTDNELARNLYSIVLKLDPEKKVTYESAESSNLTAIFKDQLIDRNRFQQDLDDAINNKYSRDEKRDALLKIQQKLGNLKNVPDNILVDLMFAFRSIGCFDDIAKLCEEFPDNVKNMDIVRKQWALALNRSIKGQPKNKNKALLILKKLIKECGPDPETFSIMGRVYKDRYTEYKKKKDVHALSSLDNAIDAYISAFKLDPRYYIPGVNAITLLLEKGDDDSINKTKELTPVVIFALSRFNGINSTDYWVVSTMLELSCINSDWTLAKHLLHRVIDLAKESWMLLTTLQNLKILKKSLSRREQSPSDFDKIINQLEEHISHIIPIR